MKHTGSKTKTEMWLALAFESCHILRVHKSPPFEFTTKSFYRLNYFVIVRLCLKVLIYKTGVGVLNLYLHFCCLLINNFYGNGCIYLALHKNGFINHWHKFIDHFSWWMRANVLTKFKLILIIVSKISNKILSTYSISNKTCILNTINCSFPKKKSKWTWTFLHGCGLFLFFLVTL